MPQYGSKFRAFVVNIRPEIKIPHPTMPVIVNTIPAMAAEFGVHRPEIEVETDAGTELYGDISGFFYDLDADSAAKGWTEEEYEIAKARLDALCQTWPEAIWPLEAVAPSAPWPTYDTTAAGKIAVLAGELGLIDAALAYEKYTKNRKSVIEQLEKAAETAGVEEELVAT